MTCPFSKLGLSNVLWFAHFNSLLLLRLVLSLLLFRSKHATQPFWHHPQLEYIDIALSSGTPLTCSHAGSTECQGDEGTTEVSLGSCVRGFLELNSDPRNTARQEKGHSPFIGLAVRCRRTEKISLAFLSFSVKRKR